MFMNTSDVIRTACILRKTVLCMFYEAASNWWTFLHKMTSIYVFATEEDPIAYVLRGKKALWVFSGCIKLMNILHNIDSLYLRYHRTKTKNSV